MSEFPKKSEDTVNTFTIAMIGGVAAILLWAAVVALQAYYAKTGGALEQARATDGQDKALRAARAEQLGALADYTWVDRKAGTAKIPIERAMQLVVLDARAGKDSYVPAVGPHDTPTVPPQTTTTPTPPPTTTTTSDVPPAPTLPLEGGGSDGATAPIEAPPDAQ